jgi:hypothetical protein
LISDKETRTRFSGLGFGSQNWKRRGLLSDPYGMQVDWETLKALGATCGVDLWLLFPFGVGVIEATDKSSTASRGVETEDNAHVGDD